MATLTLQKKFLVAAGVVAGAIEIAQAIAALAVALAAVKTFSVVHWPAPPPISLSLSPHLDELDSLPSSAAVFKVAYESTVFVVTVPNTAGFMIPAATQAPVATATAISGCPIDDQATHVRLRLSKSVKACADAYCRLLVVIPAA